MAKTFDELGLIVEAEAVSVTASCTGVEIDGLQYGDASYIAVLQSGDTTGTVDGSNYYSFVVEVSDALGGTYVPISAVYDAGAEGDTIEVGFTANELRVAYGDDAKFFRVSATKVGTTATAITYTAFLSKV